MVVVGSLEQGQGQVDKQERARACETGVRHGTRLLRMSLFMFLLSAAGKGAG